MCGIAGFVLRHGNPDPGVVRSMCEQIRHRGPDDDGYYVAGPCALGMRRLSIIDLRTGRQPIGNEDGTIWVVFNGEIYNYQQLRRELERTGHTFRTASDTETLVHLYEEEGRESICRLRGMFAYSVWDSRNSRLLLVRDRFGKKPLYYADLPEGLYFASEIKCFRAAGVPLELDEAALQHYLHLGFIPHPRSVYGAVRKVAPGGWLLRESDGTIYQGRYWSAPLPAREQTSETSEQDLARELRQRFDESVRIRMAADVPLGAFLSGGIDSGSVVASMALQSSEPVRTFSVGFEQASINELPYAALVARKYGTEHHAIVVKPDVVDLVPRLVRQFDEPFGDSSAIPTYVVSEFAAGYVKVVLSGDGGDELFAGYPSFFQVEQLRRWDRVPALLRHAVSEAAKLLPYRCYGKNFLRLVTRPNALERYFEANYAPRFLLEKLVAERWLPPDGEDHLRSAFADCLPPEPAPALHQAIYFEAACKLTEDILVKVDRMAMASSLEVRCPLLDHELAALAAHIPPQWNMKNGRGKRMFLQAVGDRLPPELLELRKTGFSAPLALWFRGALRDVLRDHLLAPRFLQSGLVSPAFVRGLVDEHMRGRRDNHYMLWRLLVLDLWIRDNEILVR